MWQKIMEFLKWGGRKLGIIQHLEKITDHKQINANAATYSIIDENKMLYSGYLPRVHDLRYMGTTQWIERKKKSLGMPKVIAKKMARLVFNEGVKFSVADEKAEQWEYVKGLFTSNKFIREFQRYLEYMFALGGLAVEVYMDGDEPKIAYATADAFFPLENDSEQIDEAVIANTFKKNGLYYTLLKWHEWIDGKYTITNELYESSTNHSLGDKVSLSKLFPDMAPVTDFEDIKHSLFIYFKPNEANNLDITSPLGVSIFENAKDTLDMLDTMYDFWNTEFRLGKRRVVVPHYMVDTRTNSLGESYLVIDDSEELFVALNGREMDEFQIKDLTVDIRAEQVIHSIQSLLDILSMQVGLSQGTFTFTKQGVKTATQVVSENSETYQTRSSHLLVIEDALRDLICTVFEVVKEVNHLSLEPLERDDITIDFNDGVFTDSESKAAYYIMLYKAGAISQLDMIQNINDCSDEEAKEILSQINSEEGDKLILTEQAIANAELGIGR